MFQRLAAVLCFALLLTPALALAAPVAVQVEEQQEGWWVNTSLDRNQNSIGDMVEKYHDHPLFLDEDNTLPLIIDFDHTPTDMDIACSSAKSALFTSGPFLESMPFPGDFLLT